MADDPNPEQWGNTVAAYTTLISLICAALFVGAIVFFIL